MIRNTADKEKVLLFVKSLKEKYGEKVEKVVLFGSVAKKEDKELGCGCADNKQLRFI